MSDYSPRRVIYVSPERLIHGEYADVYTQATVGDWRFHSIEPSEFRGQYKIVLVKRPTKGK